MAQVIVDLSGDESRLKRAYDAAEKADKSLRDSLADTGKVGQSAAETIGREFDAAGDKSVKSMNLVLKELRKHGPAGKNAAQEVERHFRETGKMGRKEMASVVDALGKLDDEAAVVARNAVTEFKKVETQGDRSFGDGAIKKLGTFTAGFVSAGSAISAITEYLREQQEIMTAAMEQQMELAKAQQESAKNLAAYSAFDRNQLLQEAVPEIARKTGFSDLGQLTLALGTAASSGATPEQAISAVQAAAGVDRLTPENVGNTAAGAVAILKQTGLQDARQAIALLQTAGTQAKITESSAIIKEMPAALGSTMMTVPGQDPQEAARQAAALFTNITQVAGDTKGASSATFQKDFANRMGTFFRDAEKTRVNARSELQALQNKKTPLERDLVRMAELEKVIPQLEAMNDPGTLFGRLQILQQSPDIAKEFVGAGFGEQGFRPVLTQMQDPNSMFSKGLTEAFNAIQASPEFYAKEVKNLQSGTPQMALAYAQGQADAGIAAKQGFDLESAGMATIRKMTADTLEVTRPNGTVDGFLASLSELFIDEAGWPVPAGAGLAGDTAVEEAVSAISLLRKRRDELAKSGFTSSELASVEAIDTTVEGLRQVLLQQVKQGSATPSSVKFAAKYASNLSNNYDLPLGYEGDTAVRQSASESQALLQKIATLLEQQLAATQQTATNTSPANNPPNYGKGLDDAADEAERTSF